MVAVEVVLSWVGEGTGGGFARGSSLRDSLSASLFAKAVCDLFQECLPNRRNRPKFTSKASARVQVRFDSKVEQRPTSSTWGHFLVLGRFLPMGLSGEVRRSPYEQLPRLAGRIEFIHLTYRGSTDAGARGSSMCAKVRSALRQKTRETGPSMCACVVWRRLTQQYMHLHAFLFRCP